MKIKNITAVGKKKVYDLSINDENYDNQHYVLENGVVTHNTGIYYSANSICIIGRSQEKVGTEIKGYHFKIKIEKSRFVKEATTIPISVMFDGGISLYSGLLEEAMDCGLIVKPKNGWYSIVDLETGEIEDKLHRAKAFIEKDMWESSNKNELSLLDKLKPHLVDKYKLVHTTISEEEVSNAFIDEEEDIE